MFGNPQVQLGSYFDHFVLAIPAASAFGFDLGIVGLRRLRGPYFQGFLRASTEGSIGLEL